MEDEYKRKIFEATLSERSERYDEMVKNMKDAVIFAYNNKVALDMKAHNLFSVSYKNLAGSRRASWRVLFSEKSKYKGSESDRHKCEIAEAHMKKIEKDLCEICHEAISIIDKYILSREEVMKDKESKIFFLKMKGDYYRYQAEVETDERLGETTEKARKSYEEAFEESMSLPPTSPIRLGLSLNYSVFYYEILKEVDKACELAKKSFDDAIAELDMLSEENYKDSTLIMQLLRDNLTLWTSPERPSDEPECDDVEPERD